MCLQVTGPHLLASKFAIAIQIGTNLLKYAQHSANMFTIRKKNASDKQIITANYNWVYTRRQASGDIPATSLLSASTNDDC